MAITNLRLPLEGIRILDLTMVWAGPFATRLLGDMGAEVIKVEAARAWDLLRILGLQPRETPEIWNKSAYFAHNNRNKYACTLDLTHQRGRELLLRLVAASDVVIENYRADVLERLGLGYETLRSARPDIILVSMPAHGATGPEAGGIAYGTHVEQLSGLASLTGYPDDPQPYKSGIAYGDPWAGTTAAAAVLAALLYRRRTGKGQRIEVAHREALTNVIGEYVLAYAMDGRQPPFLGNRHPLHAPHGVYPCAGDDQWVAVACESDEEFRRLCDAIGRPELAEDPRFATEAARLQHQDELDDAVRAWTSGRDHYQAMHQLQAAGVTAGAVLSVPEVHQDPHLRARGFWEPVAHPGFATWDVDGVAWRLSRTPAHIRLPAPRFGEHNDYVFRTLLGLSDEEIIALEREGVIGGEPDLSLHR
ncbi:MAG TPA: CoA transferase [Dehalococcoidia bacterium]